MATVVIRGVTYTLPPPAVSADWGNANNAIVTALADAVNNPIGPSIFALGAKGDGVHDDAPAIQAAMDVGGVVNLPAGNYRLGSKLQPTKAITLAGVNCGLRNTDPATVLIPDAGVVALDLTAVDGASPAFTYVHDLRIEPADKSGTAHGLISSTLCRLERLMVSGCSGDGIHIWAGNGHGNANQSYIANCMLVENNGDGLYIGGSDANNVMVSAVESSNNGRWQFNNESVLPNSYFVCLAECGEGLGTYRCTGSGTVYFGCYLEVGGHYGTSISPVCPVYPGDFDYRANSPLIEISGDGEGAQALVVGIGSGDGTGITTVLVTAQGSGFTAATAEVVRGGGGGSGATFSVLIADGKVVGVDVVEPGSGFEYGAGAPSFGVGDAGMMRLGGGLQILQRTKGITRAIDGWLAGYGTNGAPLFSASVADVHYNGEPDRTNLLAWNESAKTFESQNNANPDTSGIRYVHQLSTGETGGRGEALAPGSVEFPNGFWTAGGSAGRWVGAGTEAPTAGAHAQGDVVLNTSAAAGGFVGWVCTSGGTPGTWKQFGAIEP